MHRRSLLLLPLASPALAQAAWPSRPLRIIVPFAPGGPVEVPARFIAERIAPELGQPVIVEAKPGAGGALGIQHVIQANDPHTLLVTTSAVAVLPAMLANAGFDPRTDLRPVTMLTDAPMLLLARPDNPWRDLVGLLAAARARPGAISFGSSGAGSTTHLGGALLGFEAKVDLLHVPYRGAAPAATALYAGDTDLLVTGMGEAMPHLREGRLVALCVTSATRSPALPQVMAAAEVVPGYAMSIWYAMFGPRALPDAAVARLNALIAPLRTGTSLAQRMQDSGVALLLDGPAPLAERLARELPQWQRLAQQTGLKAD
jgi:tripartite-type tricarboxylate transporter receptor subunit TctC